MSGQDAARPVAVVTGGSRGIGAASARALARDGYDILLSYVARPDAADQVVAECRSVGARAVAVRMDSCRPEQVDAFFEQLDGQLGRLDVLVNNAGTLPAPASLTGMTPDRISHTLTVNAVAPALCAARAVARMSTADGGAGGVVVNVSSRAAQLGAPGEGVDYAMSKGAVDSLTTGLAREVAGLGIRVVGVRPGLIDTDMNAAQPGRLDRLMGTVPLGRAGTADEVAEVVAWLVSARASYVTGVTVDVSGGR